jgi:hypothetical protein
LVHRQHSGRGYQRNRSARYPSTHRRAETVDCQDVLPKHRRNNHRLPPERIAVLKQSYRREGRRVVLRRTTRRRSDGTFPCFGY